MIASHELEHARPLASREVVLAAGRSTPLAELGVKEAAPVPVEPVEVGP
jgi:hypothetical protein